MPNTLAHIGIQTLVTRALLKEADVKWIWAGCILPDLPWMVQRAGRVLLSDPPIYDIRLYAIVQASLLFSLIFAAMLACWTVRPGRVFTILALGSVMHLLLDAMQTKWANGVHLFAPLSWDLVRFDLFWPEDAPTWILTGLGVIVAIYAWIRLPKTAEDLVRPQGRRLVAFGVLAGLYAGGPFLLTGGPLAADNHFVATLQAVDDRSGKPISIDRNRLVQGPQGPELRAWTGDRFTLTGKDGVAIPEGDALISLQGHFSDPGRIEVDALHRHAEGVRNITSYLGLLLVLAWWGHCLGKGLVARRRP